MKKLYEFTVWKESEKDGTKSYAPNKFFLRKPSRALIDDAELFYSVEFSNNIKLGLLTKAQLATKFSDEVSTFSQKDKSRYGEAYVALASLENQFQAKSLKKVEERTEEEKKEIESIAGKILDLRDEMQDIESLQQSLFDHTAEIRARNRLVLWWTFNLTYFEDGKPFFGEGSFEDKLKQYDKYDESEDPFFLSVARKMIYLVSFWYTGRTESKQDFDKVAGVVGVNINPEEMNKNKPITPEPENASPPATA